MVAFKIRTFTRGPHPMMPHHHEPEIRCPKKKGKDDPIVEDPLRRELSSIRKNNRVRRSRLEQVRSEAASTSLPLHIVKH